MLLNEEATEPTFFTMFVTVSGFAKIKEPTDKAVESAIIRTVIPNYVQVLKRCFKKLGWCNQLKEIIEKAIEDIISLNGSQK
jgi:hypothetical protein